MSETELCPVCGEAMTAAPEGNYECSGLTCPFGLTHTPKSLAYWRAQLAERHGDQRLREAVTRMIGECDQLMSEEAQAKPDDDFTISAVKFSGYMLAKSFRAKLDAALEGK